MPCIAITLKPEQEGALRREYEYFCTLLTKTIPASPAPGFEQYVAAKLTGSAGEIADEMVRSIISTGSYRHLDQWFKGRFATFVLSFLRGLRTAGFGFVRGKEARDEDLAKGTAWLLDCLETELGTPLPPESKTQLLLDMPRCAYLVETLYPSESIRRLFDTAEQFLADCYSLFARTRDDRYLAKSEFLIEFLSRFPEWQGGLADDWQARIHDARKEQERTLSWADRVLAQIVERRRSLTVQ